VRGAAQGPARRSARRAVRGRRPARGARQHRRVRAGVDARVSPGTRAADHSAWARLTAGPTGRYAVWEFHWLADHEIMAGLGPVRVHARGDLLDVGCGSKPSARVFDGRVRRYWGTDLAGSRYLGAARPDAFATAEAQPFRAASFDTVLGLSM